MSVEIEMENYEKLVSEIKRLKNENNRLCKEISGSESQRARECRKLVLAEAALSEIRALPDDLDKQAEEDMDAGYWSGMTDAAEQIRDILKKHET